MKNLETTKRLLQLTTDLHNLNNKLYQLKITSEVFVVEKDKYLVDSSLINGEIENIIKEINNTLEDVEMNNELNDDEYATYQEGLKIKAELSLQKRIDNGEMLNVGSDNNPHWVSKEVWNIVMKVSDKYYPNAKKK